MWIKRRDRAGVREWIVRRIGRWSTFMVAAVWLVHGLFNKLLHFSPRHLQIVQSVPGLAGSRGELVLTAVGMCEVAIAVWVVSGWAATVCAAVQTVFLLSMNIVELSVARSLLLWPAGLVPINLAFLAVAWVAASSRQHATNHSEGLRPSDSLTRSLAGAPQAPLRSRGLIRMLLRPVSPVLKPLRALAAPPIPADDFVGESGGNGIDHGQRAGLRVRIHLGPRLSRAGHYRSGHVVHRLLRAESCHRLAVVSLHRRAELRLGRDGEDDADGDRGAAELGAQ